MHPFSPLDDFLLGQSLEGFPAGCWVSFSKNLLSHLPALAEEGRLPGSGSFQHFLWRGREVEREWDQKGGSSLLKWKLNQKRMSQTFNVCVFSCFGCVQLFVTIRTVAFWDPLSMRFSRQEYWSGFPYPPPRDIPNLGIKTASLAFQDSSPLRRQGSPNKKTDDQKEKIHLFKTESTHVDFAQILWFLFCYSRENTTF